MQSSENKEYSAADIERYHAGSMPADEMYALEKAAMEDPFLADALEGYQFTSTPAADLQTIRERLHDKKEKTRIIPLYRRIDWLKVAAAVLILAGGAWIAIRMSASSDTEMAIQKQPASKNAEDQDQKSNSPFISDSVQNSIVKLDDQKLNKVKKQLDKNMSRPEATSIEINENEATVTNIQNETTNYSTRRTAPIELPSNQSDEARSRMANNRGFDNNAVMNRSIPEPEANNRNRSQFENFMRERAAHQADKDLANSEGQKARTANDTIRNLNVVMQPSNQPPAEVVILSKTKSIEAKRPMVIIDTLEPAEGRANFDDYIASNLKAPEELRLKSMTGGEVQLSFDVNTKGEPINIAVVKSLCEECDAEAIRLLKEGPKWKKKKNARGRITIRF